MGHDDFLTEMSVFLLFITLHALLNCKNLWVPLFLSLSEQRKTLLKIYRRLPTQQNYKKKSRKHNRHRREENKKIIYMRIYERSKGKVSRFVQKLQNKIKEVERERVKGKGTTEAGGDDKWGRPK